MTIVYLGFRIVALKASNKAFKADSQRLAF